MSKKRKLNSNNPKYTKVISSNESVIKEKKLMCNAKVRDTSGNVVPGVTVPVHGVWFEN